MELVGDRQGPRQGEWAERLARSRAGSRYSIPHGYGAGYLDVLGMSWARGRDCGTRLRLQMGTAPIVKLSLETSGILEIFDVVHTRKEALSAW